MMDILIVFLIVLDQVSKYIIMHNVTTEITIIPNFFYITYLKNTGAAWSIFSSSTMILTFVSAIAVGLMLYYYKTQKLDKLTQISLVLMISGAFGNFVDRLVLHYVRDFLHFYIFGYDFPVFNVADIALCVGVGLLLFAALKGDKHAH